MYFFKLILYSFTKLQIWNFLNLYSINNLKDIFAFLSVARFPQITFIEKPQWRKTTVDINNYNDQDKKRKHGYLIQSCPDKAFQGTVANRKCQSEICTICSAIKMEKCKSEGP